MPKSKGTNSHSHTGWSQINIRDPILNRIKDDAEKNGRSAANQLEWILRKAGVKPLYVEQPKEEDPIPA